MYAGSQVVQIGGRNLVKKVVHLLMQKYFDKGHALYLDNFYTSVGLADELIGKNTYVTGTLRPNQNKGNDTFVQSYQDRSGPARRTRRWPLAVFYRMLDISASNCYVVSLSTQAQGQKVESRFKFMKRLAEQNSSPDRIWSVEKTT
ncbi:hypothetical protein HW555_003239 [Spodoptera exigua]|uniref:PiggyBac transposable element-derived protein domain-containing protein n=1 Tax=Spodoptera exigua TaxID=7107 RepID=A0A835GP65_SPOEX|nr:hypothetical protein HW555_003239 [Spodoptera exigua]